MKVIINIRPVSDLKNKYQDIEQKVLKENENIYLTKNGYGAMVLISLEKYEKIIEQFKQNKEKNKSNNDESFEEISKLYSNEEAVPKIKRKQ